MDFDKADWRKYLRTIEFCEDHVSVRDSNFAPTDVDLSRSGRYHKPGQATYYLTSGENDAETFTVENPRRYNIRPGSYQVVDLIAAGEDYPELREKLIEPQQFGGWGFCQDLRDHLEGLQVSGHIAPSARDPEKHNLILYRLDHKEESDGFFTDGWQDPGRRDSAD